MVPPEPLLDRVMRLLGPFIERRGFAVDHDEGPMGEAWVRLQDDEFVVTAFRDRGGFEWFTVGTKVRPRPRAHLRSFLLERLVSYLDGGQDPNPTADLETQARWLVERQGRILDSAFLNSEDLNFWNLNAARLLFGQKPYKAPRKRGR
jgi:hypothetical protein